MAWKLKPTIRLHAMPVCPSVKATLISYPWSSKYQKYLYRESMRGDSHVADDCLMSRE